MGRDGDPLDRLSKQEIRDLLGKGWLTHDGMWFVHTAAELGMDRANVLNRASIRGMSEIEIRRLVAALATDTNALTSSDDLCLLLTEGLAVLLPESVSSLITVSAPDSSTVCVEWDDGEYFAYKGMRRAGLLDGYECGVVYRIECWLEALDIPHDVDPPTGLCRMAVDGRCVTRIHLARPSQLDATPGSAP